MNRARATRGRQVTCSECGQPVELIRGDRLAQHNRPRPPGTRARLSSCAGSLAPLQPSLFGGAS